MKATCSRVVPTSSFIGCLSHPSGIGSLCILGCDINMHTNTLLTSGQTVSPLLSHVRWEWMLPWPCPLSRTGRMFLWSVDPECQTAAGRSHGPSDWSFGWEAPRNPAPGSTPLFCHYEAHPRPQTQTGSECTHMQEVKVLRDSQEAVFNMLKRQCFKIYCVCVCLVSTFNLNADAALLKAMWMSLKSAELLLTKRRAWFNTGAVSIWVAVCERDRGNNIWKNI